MQFPIVYKAKVNQKRGLIIVLLVLAVIFGAIGFKMKADTGESSGFIIAAIMAGLAILLFLVLKLRANQQSQTEYIVNADSFVLREKGKETHYNYSEYLFSGTIQTVNWNKFYILEMQNQAGKKKKITVFLSDADFRNLLNDITAASTATLPQGAGYEQ